MLDLSESGLSSMEVLKDYPDLREVILSYNNIPQITYLEYTPKLLEINLDHNAISRIENLNPVKGLVSLNLSYNSINRIEGLETLVYLEHLDLSHNNIAVISNLWRLTNLKSLNLSHNKIKAFGDLLANNNLSTIDLSFNGISILETNSELLPLSLKHMNLRGNNIANILEVRVLDELEALIDVDLDENPMVGIIESKGISPKMFILYLLRHLKLIELNREPISLQEKGMVNQLSDSINPEIFKYPNELPLLFVMLAERIPAPPKRQSMNTQKLDRTTQRINDERYEKVQGSHRNVQSLPISTTPPPITPSKSPSINSARSPPMNSTIIQTVSPSITPRIPPHQPKQEEPDKLDLISQQLLELREIVKEFMIRPSLQSSIEPSPNPVPISPALVHSQSLPHSESISHSESYSRSQSQSISQSHTATISKLTPPSINPSSQSPPDIISDIHQISLPPFNFKSSKKVDRSSLPILPAQKIIKIQSLIRRFLTRCRFLRYLSSVSAAIQIQSCWRGYLVRRKLNPLSAYNTKCPDCRRVVEYLLPEIKSLKQEMRSFIEEQRNLSTTSSKHEKALRYLFDQVAGLQKVVRTS